MAMTAGLVALAAKVELQSSQCRALQCQLMFCQSFLKTVHGGKIRVGSRFETP